MMSRIRAGLLEWGSVDVLRAAQIGDRIDREGQVHNGSDVVWGGRHRLFLDTKRYAGKHMMAYSQTKITEDLYAARDRMGGQIVDCVADVRLHDTTTDAPFVTYIVDEQSYRLDCDYIAGCDGFHGVSRRSIPASVPTTYEKIYPFGWLGVLSETPLLPGLVYARHERGFALASIRNPMLSRYYIQCDLEDSLDAWPDERFWEELKMRFPPEVADRIVTGPTIEKSIAPLRSFVAEPMRYGRLFLAGDAAHIVPPTGAKGLNLAISDAFYLARAMTQYYGDGETDYLDRYSDMALRRAWGAARFSWWMTLLLHRFPDQGEFDRRAQEVELAYIASSDRALTSMCEQYAGLPLES